MDHRAYEGSVGMLNTPYVKKDAIKNYFPLPNAIFDLGLHHIELSIYAYLLRIEDRRTYQCIVSYGNVTPGERGVEKDGRLWNLGRPILQNEEELAPLLSEKAKEVLEKLRDNQSELNDLGECEVFVCGFRLGARIMLEVLDGSDKWGEFEE